jgi:hypothetical protein
MFYLFFSRTYVYNGVQPVRSGLVQSLRSKVQSQIASNLFNLLIERVGCGTGYIGISDLT